MYIICLYVDVLKIGSKGLEKNSGLWESEGPFSKSIPKFVFTVCYIFLMPF